MGRYRWGATQGYQNLKNRDLTPPVMEHPNHWRLDQMLAWEDKRIARAEKEARRSRGGRSRRSRRCASSPGGAGDAAHDDAATEAAPLPSTGLMVDLA
jgi:hypothetical protein